MSGPFLEQTTSHTLSIVSLTSSELKQWREQASQRENDWLDATRFEASPGSHCVIPDDQGSAGRVLAGRADGDWLWSIAGLSRALGEVSCSLDNAPDAASAHMAALGFGLGAYTFNHYKKSSGAPAQLVLPSGVDMDRLRAEMEAVNLTRDLINTPANDMMPEHLAAAAQTLAERHGARFSQVVGDDLLEQNFPAIHAVGRASANPPRLIELNWGEPNAPKVTIVGKGVCFDSGGLDIKPAAGMRLMKKDMGGAAHALGVASLLMATGCPISLRVLIPAVENAISGNAYRPGDVLSTRAGKTVEVDNTDAEGRIILCDALALACEDPPQVMVDFATLTGAARVAVGTDLPAMFANDDSWADALLESSDSTSDPMWRLPLHRPYRELINSRIADIVNSGGGPYAGAITAALFLDEFVSKDVPWAHFDLMAWNVRARPGRPEGGEAMSVRAVANAIATRFV